MNADETKIAANAHNRLAAKCGFGKMSWVQMHRDGGTSGRELFFMENAGLVKRLPSVGGLSMFRVIFP